MIRKLITALILLPLAVVLIALAVANRQTVVVSFDPFDATQPALAIPRRRLVVNLGFVCRADLFRRGRGEHSHIKAELS